MAAKARSSSPLRFRRQSLERIPSFFTLSPSARSLNPRNNSPRLRLNSASSVDSCSPVLEAMDFPTTRENISVTVRFRPLNPREIDRGDENAWYPDGDTLVRSEYSATTAYGFDKVFGPATTTRSVYDTAARHVVRGSMEGINGTVFAYGVTSSGKTHTMHGDQKSPGIIPLAIKDVFNIIQDTVGRDFLLRVSYLEIYNEVINDLLDTKGQNLRVREDSQGTFVEGITEEVITSPKQALFLIAAGEEHRHVGSNNFNLQSSRSHTIFTLTIESSVHGDSFGEVNLSQLNLIDLAGSESSKTETTGIRRREGSYINKSLLTLGTVISKLSDGKHSHIPYRDSKLTRLLQSSLSGHGRVSLICTITPASSNIEETHNTLKFAHRAKRVELYGAPNRIIDEKSLIKKYQKQIAILTHELEQFKRGHAPATEQHLLTLRQKFEAGQVKMQSRLEEAEQTKAALMGRIQRLTKLILVSTKNTIPVNLPEKPTHRRRHSFGEDELAYLPGRRHDFIHDNDDDSGLTEQDTDSSTFRNGTDDNFKDQKKSKRRSMLSWFKSRKQDSKHGSPVTCVEDNNFQHQSPASTPSSMRLDLETEFKNFDQKSFNRSADELLPFVDSYPRPTQAGELFCLTACRRRPPPTGTTMADQIDLFREQVKMLAGEIAFCTSSLKRLSEQAAKNPDDTQLQAQILKLEDEIEEREQQTRVLKQRMIGIREASANDASVSDLQEALAKLTGDLNEKTFELEIKSADNRILQEQLQAKSAENEEAQETILFLHEQLASTLEKNLYQCQNGDVVTVDSIGREMRTELTSECSRGCVEELREQLLLQAVEIEKLKQEKVQLIEEKGGLQIQGQKLAEEALYAKELASAAAVELNNLAEEITQLSFQNAELEKELETTREVASSGEASKPTIGNGFHKYSESTTEQMKFMANKGMIGWNEFENDIIDDIDSWNLDSEDMKRELHARKEREASLEAILAEKELRETELQNTIDNLRRKEVDLENDLAGMWVLVANLKKESKVHNNVKHGTQNDDETFKHGTQNDDETLKPHGNEKETKEQVKEKETLKKLASRVEDEKRRGEELDRLITQLKSEELEGLEFSSLEELRSLHVKVLEKLCEVKAHMQENFGKERGQDSECIYDKEETVSHVHEVCLEATTSIVPLPC